jgi:two-component system CheB/CheR fusion protein
MQDRGAHEPEFPIVGLGASAGGIGALKTFFSHMPADTGMAFVVIVHLSPQHESHLAQVVQVSTPMPVAQVQTRVRVEPNCVYVVPPNRSLAMVDGHLDVSEIRRIEERRAPIDIFFRTLADTQGPHAIAVVLSGTGADGSMGLKRIKEEGGICLVQEPGEAEYSEMPRNSIATGLVDHILPVAIISRPYRCPRRSRTRPVRMKRHCEKYSPISGIARATTFRTTSGRRCAGASAGGWRSMA